MGPDGSLVSTKRDIEHCLSPFPLPLFLPYFLHSCTHTKERPCEEVSCHQKLIRPPPDWWVLPTGENSIWRSSDLFLPFPPLTSSTAERGRVYLIGNSEKYPSSATSFWLYWVTPCTLNAPPLHTHPQLEGGLPHQEVTAAGWEACPCLNAELFVLTLTHILHVSPY